MNGQSIAIASDMVCPWCFVGKRRFERALTLLDGAVSAPRWLPFELNPTMPFEGVERRAYIEKKFGRETASRFEAEITEIGLADGIRFAFDRITVLPNTFLAHRLAWMAEREGVQDAVIEAIFQRYFELGESIGDRAVLVDIAAAAGLGAQNAEKFLKSDRGIGEVRTLEEWVRGREITMVPTFLINDQVAIVGADTAAEIAGVLSGEVGAAPVSREQR